jgi:hypothetical protein
LAPWAGMRCPDEGKWNDRVVDPAFVSRSGHRVW